MLCGPAMPTHRDVLFDRLKQQGQRASCGLAAIPQAAQVARLAESRITKGDLGDDALKLVPLYIAPPPISQPKPENRPPVYGDQNAAKADG